MNAQGVTRDNVTVTPDQKRNNNEAPCATTSAVARDGSASLAVEERDILAVPDSDPATWLKQEGLQLIMDRMGEPRERAMARLSNWSGQLEDGAVLMGILRGAGNRSGPAFHMEIADQIRRWPH
jgi:hypothetical protein